jgi:N utilization substance protein B
MIKARSAARELALNILYQTDAAGLPFSEALDTALEFADLSELDAKGRNNSEEARDYVKLISNGVKEHIEELDGIITKYALDWAVDRQPAVDRNILRIALYEMKYVDDVPPLVSIDEAVEMAKKFSTEDSGKFVNGILASFIRENS